MLSQSISLQDELMYKQIYKYGTYYNPASKHYGSNASVVCDRCHKSDLDICIGYESHDLCMPCIQEINSKYKQPVYQEIAPFGYDPSGKTRTPWCTTCDHSHEGRIWPNSENINVPTDY